MVVGEQNNPSQAANTHARDGRSSGGSSGSAPMHGAGGLPTLESLAELILSTRQFLNEQADECLLLVAYPMYFDLKITSTSRIYFISRLQPLTRQIEDHSSVISPAERMGVQSNALSGSSFAELGSFAARAWSYNNET